MKTRITLLLILIFSMQLAVSGQTTWASVSQPGVNFMAAGNNTGYAFYNESIGSHGMKYYLNKSSDSFRNFETIKTKSGDFGCYSLDEICFSSCDSGYLAEVCQGISNIYKTTDGGTTWEETGFGGTYGLSMHVYSSEMLYYSFFPGGNNYSYLMANETNIYTTKKYIFSKDNYQYPNCNTKIHFINDSTGFIICNDTLNNAVLLKSVNYGYDWNEILTVNNTTFTDMVFNTSDHCIITAANGSIYKTNDSWSSWSEININDTSGLNSVCFANDTGYIAGNNGLVYASYDNGGTWIQLDFVNTNNLIYVYAQEDEKIYVLDDAGALYSNIDDTGIDQNNKLRVTIYPNPAKDWINIRVDGNFTIKSIELYSLEGQKILQTKACKLNTSYLKKGVYLLKIDTNKGIIIEKIIR